MEKENNSFAAFSPDGDYRNQKCIDLLIELYQRDRINIEEFKLMIKGLL